MYRSMIVVSFILGVVIALIPHIVFLIAWLAGKCFSFSVSYAPFGWTAAGLALLLWSLLAYGYLWGRYRMEVNHVEYRSDEVPQAFDGYRLVHISDIHAGTFDEHPEALQRIVDSINQQDADLICFTGDMSTLSIDEVRLAESCGYRSVSLGSSRLRTETAALVSVHMMQLKNQIL